MGEVLIGIFNIAVLASLALAALSILIVVHELGHYIAARLCGVWVEEFGIGIPPKVWGKKIGETLYSINALPIGGFVRLHGESVDNKVIYPERSFLNKSALQRIFITLSGVLMNFVLAFVLFFVILWFTGVEVYGVRVGEVAVGSPSESAGLVEGDGISKINGEVFYDVGRFIDIVNEQKGQEIELEVIRGGEDMVIKVVPRENPPEGEGSLGVSISFDRLKSEHPPFIMRPLVYISKAYERTVTISVLTVQGFASLFQEVKEQGQVPKSIVGPIGIVAFLADIIGNIRRIGFLPLLDVLAVISVNLGLLNILPISPLDGGRALFAALGSVFGKKRLPQIEEKLNLLGFGLLLILVIFLTARELPAAFSSSSLSNFVDSILQ